MRRVFINLSGDNRMMPSGIPGGMMPFMDDDEISMMIPRGIPRGIPGGMMPFMCADEISMMMLGGMMMPSRIPGGMIHTIRIPLGEPSFRNDYEISIPRTEVQPYVSRQPIQDTPSVDSFRTASISQPISDNEYRLGDKIGEGAYSVVYKGQYRGSSVAVKQIKVDADKILGEIKLMKEHGDQCEKLVKVKAIFTSPGPLTMVMELCERGSLHEVLRTENSQSLKWDTKKKIALDIAQGLNYLHSKNIVHGDLKSPNVLITTHYNAKVSDYGLAELKRTSPHTSSRCSLVGSTPWMAPELLTAEGIIPYSNNSDIYSFGLTLYEMATHKIPFAGTNNAVLFNKIINGAPEQIPFGTPDYFSAIIDECRNKDPNQRPAAGMVINKLVR